MADFKRRFRRKSLSIFLPKASPANASMPMLHPSPILFLSTPSLDRGFNHGNVTLAPCSASLGFSPAKPAPPDSLPLSYPAVCVVVVNPPPSPPPTSITTTTIPPTYSSRPAGTPIPIPPVPSLLFLTEPTLIMLLLFLLLLLYCR